MWGFMQFYWNFNVWVFTAFFKMWHFLEICCIFENVRIYVIFSEFFKLWVFTQLFLIQIKLLNQLWFLFLTFEEYSVSLTVSRPPCFSLLWCIQFLPSFVIKVHYISSIAMFDPFSFYYVWGLSLVNFGIKVLIKFWYKLLWYQRMNTPYKY